MKLKYRILEKLHNVSNSEMDLLVGQCSILMRPVELCMGHTTKKKMSSFEITTL